MAKYSFYPETIEKNGLVTKKAVAEHFGMTVEELDECAQETVEKEIRAAVQDWQVGVAADGCDYGILDLETGKVVKRFTISIDVTFR